MRLVEGKTMDVNTSGEEINWTSAGSVSFSSDFLVGFLVSVCLGGSSSWAKIGVIMREIMASSPNKIAINLEFMMDL